jgi:hypothetical protein
MTVAIIGGGKVGSALARRLVLAGESVRFGARAPQGPVQIEGHDVPQMSSADAARGAAVVLLCVPAPVVADALAAATLTAGTIVVDCTNPVRWDAGPVWAPPAEGSVAQAIAAGFPTLRVLKGFNHFGAEIQGDPVMSGGSADAWFAGDDAEAKATVMTMASRMGFRAVDAGPLRNASVLENVATLWIHLASVGGQGRQFAFRADHRP